MQGIEWIVLLVAIIIIFAFGGKKLPELARSLGRAKGEFERGKRELDRELKELAKEDKDKEESKEEKGSKDEDESEIVKAAKNLDVDTEGKTEEELKKEIAEKMK